MPWISVCIRIAGKAGILLALLSVAGCVTAPDRQTSPELSVLQVNEAFYKAIQDRDFIAMKGLWASSGPVAVVHPGWPQVLGRDAVLRSWKALLADKSAVFLDCKQATVSLQGQKAAVVCNEVIAHRVVKSINVYQRRGGFWEIIFHGVRSLPSDEV